MLCVIFCVFGVLFIEASLLRQSVFIQLIDTREMTMSRTSFIRARIDPAVKAEAKAVLKTFGLTLSDALRLTLTRIARDKGLPFEWKQPNSVTRAAMAEAQSLQRARKRNVLNN